MNMNVQREAKHLHAGMEINAWFSFLQVWGMWGLKWNCEKTDFSMSWDSKGMAVGLRANTELLMRKGQQKLWEKQNKSGNVHFLFGEEKICLHTS